MDIFNVFMIAGLVHCCLFFFDTFFKSCSHFPYLYFLENTGFEVKLMRIQWFTTAFNRIIIKWGLNRSLFWTIWFDAGVFTTVLLLPLCLIATLIMTFNIWKAGGVIEKNDSGMSMELMLPGMGLPLNEIGYYILTLGICSVCHEFGHVMAAAKESVQLHGLGMLLVFILPIAYVNMNSNDLSPLPLRNQLRITCGGVWHNIVLANVAAVIFFSSSWLWAPIYTSGIGVYVKTISPNSPLLGPTGLSEHNVIYQLNNCKLKNTEGWYNCISSLIRQPAAGYCVKQSFVQEHDESIPSRQRLNGIVNCCTADSESSGSLCFEYIEGPQAAPLHLPPYSCLPARSMINQSDNYCQASHDCTSHEGHCMRPLLDNTTKIVRIRRDKGEDVLFVGHPRDLYRTVHISNWIPKYFFFNPKLPESLALFCEYIIVFSYGMAFVNILPCFYFDGQYIINIIIRYVLNSKLYSKNTRQGITLTITSLGTILLAINFFYLILNKLS